MKAMATAQRERRPGGRAADPALAGVRQSPHQAEQILLGFDFGLRRIGVAIGNSLTREARPLARLDAVGAVRWRRIADLIGQWQPQRLVVGVARHPDGTAHELTAACERFARQLEGRFGLPVARVDERYSTAVTASGRDDEAAAVILQQHLDETRR